jgi:hypothetical protein
MDKEHCCPTRSDGTDIRFDERAVISDPDMPYQTQLMATSSGLFL